MAELAELLAVDIEKYIKFVRLSRGLLEPERAAHLARSEQKVRIRVEILLLHHFAERFRFTPNEVSYSMKEGREMLLGLGFFELRHPRGLIKPAAVRVLGDILQLKQTFCNPDCRYGL